MPRVSYSSDYLLASPRHLWYGRVSAMDGRFDDGERREALSARQIDEILSRKLYEQMGRSTPVDTDRAPSITSTGHRVDPELHALIDRFFDLTYLNTIPMVNLLATAVATNFLQENIRDLDRRLQEQQASSASFDVKRGTSLLSQLDDDDDDNLSWASAPN